MVDSVAYLMAGRDIDELEVWEGDHETTGRAVPKDADDATKDQFLREIHWVRTGPWRPSRYGKQQAPVRRTT